MDFSRLFSMTFLTCACLAVSSSSSHSQIVLYDGSGGAPSFTYGDMVMSVGSSSFTVDTPSDNDSANGRFGGVGRDLPLFVNFENDQATLRIEFRPLATNEATTFRMILADDDGEGVRDNFQYVANIATATAIDDGSGFLSVSIPISDGDSVFQQASFGFNASADFIEDFGLAQWQLQSNYGGSDRLSLEVRRVEIETSPAVTEEFLAQADARIEQHRKADLTIRVVDTAGNPVAGATLDVQMQRHSFQWGTAIQSHRINGNGTDDSIYRQKLLENFNTVVYENEHKWPAWEGLYGFTFGQTQSFNALPWIAANNLYLRGHYVSWATLTGSEGFVSGPGVPPGTTANLQAELFNHIDEKLTALENSVGEWDVINHPIGWDPPTYEEEFGISFYRDIINYTRTVTDRDLWINEDNVLGGNRFRQGKETQEEYERIIQYLIDQGAAPDGIGFQGHFVREWGRDNVAAEDIYASLERFANLVPRLKITELDIDVENDETKQATLMNQYLTTFFSHPAVEGVTMWGFWEGQIWRPDAALYRNDWSEKPALLAYQSLVFDDWWTDETGSTSNTGEFSVRGFKGDYLVEVTVGGFTETQSVSLLDAETIEFTIPLAGDYDQSGEIDGSDVDLMFAAYGPADDAPEYDLDGSGIVDFADVELLVTQFGQTKPGDLDFDGSVDVLGDAFVLVSNLGSSDVGYAGGDINGDGMVSVLGDAFLLISNLGQ
jgi:GH35 family endo-1,4-beta-xylanase